MALHDPHLSLAHLAGVALRDNAMGDAARSEVTRSFMDTLAVAHAGRNEPVVHALRSCYGERPALPEHQALLAATSAHALDYDDVDLPTISHPSAVIVPALMAAGAQLARPDMLSAYVAGFNILALLGHALGGGHYAAGWHATSTLGPVAAAAAVARLLGMTEPAMRNALGLAMCQAAGMQKSFGSMAKPLQAGLASSAGLRSALWAAAGISGPQDPLGASGFLSLYGGTRPELAATAPPQPIDIPAVSRKAYPCCYASHRLILAGIELHNSELPASMANVVFRVRTGTLLPLNVVSPQDGNQAKFCARYLAAAALTDGAVEFQHFTIASLKRADILAMQEKVRIVEEGPATPRIEDGTVLAAAVDAAGTVLAEREARYFPGSPESPLSKAQLEAKLLDCFGGSVARVAELHASTARLMAP